MLFDWRWAALNCHCCHFCGCAGAKQARRATWIGASCDQTFIRIDESLINAHTLARSNIVASYSSIGKQAVDIVCYD
jgi:hypothetical protein